MNRIQALLTVLLVTPVIALYAADPADDPSRVAEGDLRGRLGYRNNASKPAIVAIFGLGGPSATRRWKWAMTSASR